MEKLSSITEKILFWLVLALFIFVPLYPKLPIVNIAKTFVAVRLEDYFIASVIGIWMIWICLSGLWRVLLKERLFVAILFFWGVGVLSCFSGLYLTHTVGLQLTVLHLLRRVEVMALLPVVYTVIRTKDQAKTVLWVLSGVTITVCIYAFGQRYLGWPVISTGNSEFSKGLILSLTPGARVNSTFAGHYDLAVFLVMVITVLVAFFIGWRKILFRGYLAVVGVLSVITLVMTAARLSFVALVVSVLTVICISKKWRYLLIVSLVMGLALVYPSQLRDRFISTIKVNVLDSGTRYEGNDTQTENSALNIPTLNKKVATFSAMTEASNGSTDSASGDRKIASDIAPGEPIDSTQLGVFRSFEIRMQIEWPRAINAFYKNPFLGTGYSSLGLATDNDILRSLGEVGLVGTLAFGLIHWEIFRRLWRIFRQNGKLAKSVSLGVIGLVIAFIVNSTFIDVYEASKIATLFWMTIGLALAGAKYEKTS